MMQRFLFVFLLCALLAFEAEALFPRRSDKIKCPPRGFDSVKDFDPESFISKSWFVQEQVNPPFPFKTRSIELSLGCRRLPRP